DGEGLVEGRVRITLGQITQQMGERREAVERQRRTDEPGRPRLRGLDLKGPQMLVEPGAPGGVYAVPGLKHRLEGLRATAMDQTEMPPVVTGHQLENDARFAVFAGADNDALVSPLHGIRLLAEETVQSC